MSEIFLRSNYFMQGLQWLKLNNIRRQIKKRGEIISLSSRFKSFQTIMQAIYLKLFNDKDTPSSMVNVPLSECASTSTQSASLLPQNVDNYFNAMGVYDPPHSRATSTNNPSVMLVDMFGNELAKGHVVTNYMAKVCHSIQVGIGEKKVYVEEMFEPDARSWDPT